MCPRIYHKSVIINVLYHEFPSTTDKISCAALSCTNKQYELLYESACDKPLRDIILRVANACFLLTKLLTILY